MRKKPIVIEFTGPPNSGKTTIIKMLHELLISMGYSVDVMQEDAELVPKCIPKKTWIRNVWITNGQLQSLLETKYSESDVIFLDRGFYDAIFWANFLQIQGIASIQESSSLLRILKEMDMQFDLKPDYVFFITVSTEESLRRHALQSQKPAILSTSSFLDLYNAELDKFYPTVSTPIFKMDSTSVSIFEMQQIVLKEILSILE